MRYLNSWTEEWTIAESIDMLSDLSCMASRHAGKVGPFIEHFVRKRDYKGLLETDLIEYSTEECALNVNELRFARQALAFFQKLDCLDIGIDKRQVALDTYFRYEELCAETNSLLRLRSEGAFSFSTDMEWVFERARKRCASVLGEVPQLQELKLRFGPGATTSIKKREASIVRKLGTNLDCSEDLLPIIEKVLEELPLLAEYHGEAILRSPDGRFHSIPRSIRTLSIAEELEEWSRVPVAIKRGVLSFVLKNAKTLRTVETQPILNGMLQNAIGDEMFARCKRWGLDLSNQRRNQIAAQRGSITGALATLDLRGASDTNAFWLVLEQLPPAWFELCAWARVGELENPVPGKAPIILQKFSAMGNGFTFPLESLIFWAITHACFDLFLKEGGVVSDDTIEVYGDDIICPTEIVPLVRRALHTFGFVVNSDKSYWSGPFRESCGADFYLGHDIRPVYVKERLSPALLFTMHNGLRARGMDELAKRCADFVAPAMRLYGPPGYGDGYLHSEAYPRERKSSHLARGFEGSTFKSFIRVPKRDIRNPNRDGEELLGHYSSYTRGVTELIPETCMLKLSSFDTLRRLKKKPEFMRLNLLESFSVEAPSEAIPLHREYVATQVEGESKIRRVESLATKAPTFPGTDGYKVVSNYTLGGDFSVPSSSRGF